MLVQPHCETATGLKHLFFFPISAYFSVLNILTIAGYESVGSQELHGRLFLWFLFLTLVNLCCCTRALSTCSEQRLLFIAVHGLLIAVAALVAEYGLQGSRASVVGVQGLSVDSVVVVHRLNCSTACGIFLVQGSNLCPLHWQVDSQPLGHQGSPEGSLSHFFLEWYL